MTLQQVAKTLKISPKILEEESLKLYLEQKLRVIETDIFRITQKYGIETAEEFDEKIKEGKIREKDNWESFFELDNLEAERDRLIKTLEELNA